MVHNPLIKPASYTMGYIVVQHHESCIVATACKLTLLNLLPVPHAHPQHCHNAELSG
ncbi:UNVERIFIED_CONTAM: hypothetical protein FKN15_040717 [Acipenser sinensis]